MESKGKCDKCGKVFSRRSIKKHIVGCFSEGEGPERFLMRAWVGPFFVYFVVGKDERLKFVDGFLRRLWVECCGHLSMFTIKGENYCSSPYESDDESMDVLIRDVVGVGDVFLYEYDFGSTTDMNLEIVDVVRGEFENGEIISRNEDLNFKCDKCGERASVICSECAGFEDALFCKGCSSKHECDEEMFLPVVNSPRMGVCGYGG